jgi:hypothetical protein
MKVKIIHLKLYKTNQGESQTQGSLTFNEFITNSFETNLTSQQPRESKSNPWGKTVHLQIKLTSKQTLTQNSRLTKTF